MCSGAGSPCGGAAAPDAPAVAAPSLDAVSALASIIPAQPLGAAWATTPGQRAGLSTLAVQLTDNHALADVQGVPAVVRATDPLAYSMQALGFTPAANDNTGDPYGGAATAAIGAATSTTPGNLGVWASAGVLLAALVILAAGAFAIARGD